MAQASHQSETREEFLLRTAHRDFYAARDMALRGLPNADKLNAFRGKAASLYKRGIEIGISAEELRVVRVRGLINRLKDLASEIQASKRDSEEGANPYNKIMQYERVVEFLRAANGGQLPTRYKAGFSINRQLKALKAAPASWASQGRVWAFTAGD